MYYYFIFTVFVFGALFGSFINCLLWRMRKEESLMGRSYCPKCKHMIAWYDNVPVLSFLLLRGKCRHCAKPIPWQYPLVELSTGLLFVIAFLLNTQAYQPTILPTYSPTNLTFYQPNILATLDPVRLIRDWYIICILVIIFIYDLRWYLILDRISLPAILLVFLFNAYLGFDLLNLAISGIIGGSFFLLQFLVSRGRWIGGGDIRLGILMGVALGWPDVILAIMLAYLIGATVGIGLLLSGKKSLGSELPLGVFLAPATLAMLFWGEALLAWYWNLLGF